jgi:shikimate dehydrogenase
MIGGQTRLAGVIGWPVGHSRSPRLHNYWLHRYGIDGAYVPLPVRPEDLETAVHGLRAAGFAGVNVTIPHKEAAFHLCTSLGEAAARAGAVNTLVFSENGIRGANTDGYGFMANLAAHGLRQGGGATPSGPALLLGAGGAARAIADSLLSAGTPVTIANRNPDRAQILAESLPGLRVIPWEHREAALADTALLVNTTSLGMQGNPATPIDLANAPASLVVADVVYTPPETPLLAQARAQNLKTVPGLGMLLHQAVPGFAAWFGTTPAVDQEVFAALAAPA